MLPKDPLGRKITPVDYQIMTPFGRELLSYTRNSILPSFGLWGWLGARDTISLGLWKHVFCLLIQFVYDMWLSGGSIVSLIKFPVWGPLKARVMNCVRVFLHGQKVVYSWLHGQKVN